MVWVTTKKAQKLSVSPKYVRVARESLLAVFAIGIPASLNNIMQSFAGVLLNRSLAVYGTDSLAAMGITSKIYMVLMMIMVSFAFGAMPLAAPQLIQFFLKDDAIVKTGSLMLRCSLASAPFVGLFLVFITLFQAAGKALPTLILTLSRQGILYAVCLAVLGYAFGLHGVICAQAVSDVLTALLAFILFRKSGLS